MTCDERRTVETLKDHPENVHTVFLYNSGADNRLAAVIQVAYLAEVLNRAAMLNYQHEGMACDNLNGVQLAADADHPIWLW